MCLLVIFSGCSKRSPTIKYATLCGRVIDAIDDLPIEGATVSIDDKVMARTNAEGWFKTDRFQIGMLELKFTAEEYNSFITMANFVEEGDFWLIIEGYEPGSVPLSPNSTEEIISPTYVYDLPVVNGTGSVKIAADGKIGSLLLIPYNTSMTAGEYSATLTVETSGSESSYLLKSLCTEKQIVTSGVSSKSSKEAFYQRLREKELEAIQAQLGREVPFGVSKELLSRSTLPKDEMEFYKIIGEDYGVPVTATRINDSTKSYIYLDKEFGFTIPPEDIKGLSDTFDQYYDLLVEAFAPVGMDVDGYPGIFYLLTELENYGTSYVGGYFWGVNELPRDPNDEYLQYSNEKEILFLTTFGYDEMYPTEWIERVKSTMAHELQHLINFSNRVPRIWDEYQLEKYVTETWINEGLSMVAEDLVYQGGHNPGLDEQRVIPYLGDPAGDSLCTWKNEFTDYVPAYMFMRYFVDRFGDSITQALIESDQYGLDSVVAVSGERSFILLFRDWLTAVYVGCQADSPKSGFETHDYYKTINLYKISQDFGESLALKDTFDPLIILDTTGVFILQDNQDFEQEITISIEGSSKFKLRLLMFPSGGISFNSLQPQLQKLR